MVEHGSAVFSDCIYRIKIEKGYREKVLAALRSPAGVAYRLTVAHGTCAAVLSKADLLNLPV